jgi:hypothetical protein
MASLTRIDAALAKAAQDRRAMVRTGTGAADAAEAGGADTR